MDSTEGEKLVWKRANPENNKMVKNMEKLLSIFGHCVTAYGKKTEKEIKKMKRKF